MIPCYHVRQVPETGMGGDCLMDFNPESVFPCATPGCDAGLLGEGMIREIRTGFDSRRQDEYVREATEDGWRWRKRVPA